MKRYFINTEEKCVMFLESHNNKAIDDMDVTQLFDNYESIVEVGKSEYLRKKYEYQSQNKLNMSLTISK